MVDFGHALPRRREEEMQIVTGRIGRFPHNSVGEANGFALDNGANGYFPSDAANRVLSIATAGSLLEVHPACQVTFAWMQFL
jgi:hypothetical protein